MSQDEKNQNRSTDIPKEKSEITQNKHGPNRRQTTLASELTSNWSVVAFWILIICSLTLTILVIAYLTFNPEQASRQLSWMSNLLVLNGALLGCLALIIGIQFYNDSRRGRLHGKSEAKIHRSYVISFTFIAVIPTIFLSSIFTSFYFLGVEQRFAPRIDELMKTSRVTGRAYYQNLVTDLEQDILTVRTNLSFPETIKGIQEAPILYNSYLARLAQRLNLSAIYIFDSDLKVLARAEKAETPSIDFPRPDLLSEAKNGILPGRKEILPGQFFESDNYGTVLAYMPAYEDAYLYVVREYPDGLLSTLLKFSLVVNEYEWAKQTGGATRPIFIVSFAQTALCLILVAIGFGLSQANAVARPVGRLADAAALVTRGDLTVRIGKVGRGDEIEGLIDAFNNMTNQLQSQRKELVNSRDIAEARSRFIETVLSGVGAGVLALDESRHVIIVNPPAIEILQTTEKTLIGKRLDKAVPEFAHLLDRIVDSKIAYQDKQEHRIDIVRNDNLVNLRVRGGRYQGTSGQDGYILTFDDLSSFVMAQRQVAWRDVARRVAHEIRNPLTPIQLSAQRLNKKFKDRIPVDEGRDIFEKCVDTILRQVADIGRMVSEFAEFARMPSAHKERINIAEIVKNCVFDQRLRTPDIEVEYSSSTTKIWLELDERLIRQAIANILKNAGESIAQRAVSDPSSKGKISVILNEEYSKKNVAISVKDNGIGLPDKERDRLIEPYVTNRKDGTGLGLAIVNRIVEDHGGTIRLEDLKNSSPESQGAVQGAVVTIDLPSSNESAVHTTSTNI